MSDIDTAVVDSLKVLDPKRPIREADIPRRNLSRCDTQYRQPQLQGHLPVDAVFAHALFPIDRHLTMEGHCTGRAGRPIVVPSEFCGLRFFGYFKKCLRQRGFLVSAEGSNPRPHD